MNWLYSPHAYFFILITSLLCLWLCDRRWKLALYYDSPGAKHATIVTILIGVTFFLAWDIAGIVLGIFSTNPQYTIGLNLFTPNLPVEELLFLTLLVYVSLITVEVSRRLLEWRASKRKSAL